MTGKTNQKNIRMFMKLKSISKQVEQIMDKITATKKVRMQGNSLVVFVSEECKMIGVERGDIVDVTIEKKEKMQNHDH